MAYDSMKIKDAVVYFRDMSDEDLAYWIARINKELSEDPNGKYAKNNAARLEGLRLEQESRRNGGQRRQPAPKPAQEQPQKTAAIATRKPDALVASGMNDAAAVTQRLEQYSREYHLVSPATSCDVLPEGCAVAISLVHVDPNPALNGPKEVYEVSGRLAPSLVTLQRIASAAGISWVPEKCGRLDNGRDPHYCHYRAVGAVRMFDGSARTLTGEVEIDMRDGSPQLEGMTQKAIDQTRKFILRHAESKAKNRAVADMGVKRSYAPAELQKPFAVARLMWTGDSLDPELRREAFRMRAEAMGGAAKMLYGAPQQQPRAALPAFQGHGAPPVGSISDDPSDIGTHDVDADDASY